MILLLGCFHGIGISEEVQLAAFEQKKNCRFLEEILSILTLFALDDEPPSKNVHFKFFRFALLTAGDDVDGPGYVGNSLSLHKIDDSNACFISPFHNFIKHFCTFNFERKREYVSDHIRRINNLNKIETIRITGIHFKLFNM